MCRVRGPAAVPAWPTYPFVRSFCGPWGSVTVTPDLLVVNARYWFSQPTKQLIRYSDISRYYRNRNCCYLADATGALLTSFCVRKPDELFEILGAAAVKHFEQNGMRNRRWVATPDGPHAL